MVEKKLLTLDQAAELLGVDYRTVYRLVRSGKIPAGKVGRVYRIAPDDLKTYWEQQKQRQQEHARPEATVTEGAFECAVCGKSRLSRLSVGGECDVCGDPICGDCWSAQGRRYCREHEVEIVEGPEPVELAPSACARCGRPFSRDWQTAGACQEPDCGAPLCDGCWAEQDDRFCRDHSARGEARETVLQKLRDKGEPVVEAVEARAAEAAFVNRFDEGVLALEEFVDPITGRVAGAAACQIEHTVSDEAAAVRRLLGGDLPVDESRSQYPVGATSRYEVRTRSRKGPLLGVTLEARCCVRPDRYLESGFDHEPITLVELNAILEPVIAEAEQAGHARVVVLGSPTGWAKDAVKHIAGGGRKAFRHRLLAVALWDLAEDGVHVQIADDKLDGYLDLASPGAAAEAFQRVAEHVKKRLTRRETVSVAAACETLSLGRRTVTRAFHRLAHEKDYIVVTADDIGTVISRR